MSVRCGDFLISALVSARLIPARLPMMRGPGCIPGPHRSYAEERANGTHSLNQA